MNQQPHLLISHGQIATGILVCGEPDRVNRIAERFLTNSVLIAENREYRIINGDYQGNPVTLCSTGMGAPSMIIALEELKRCGAEYIIRVGSAGALQSNIGLGELIVAEGAVRDDGGSKAYIPSEFPAIADHQLVHLLKTDLSQQNINYHSGIVRSHDSFYTDDEDSICEYWHKKGVLGADMETSALLTVGRLRQLKTAAILNNVVLYQQNVSEGISAYVNEAEDMIKGEQLAAHTALNALIKVV